MVDGLTLPIQDSYSSKEAWIALVRKWRRRGIHRRYLEGMDFDPD
jgi:hypothetical protein